MEAANIAAKLLRQTMATNLQSLAWQLRPELAARARSAAASSDAESAASRRESTAASRRESTAPPQKTEGRSALDYAANKQFIASNEGWMRDELQRRRQRARAAFERATAQSLPVAEVDWVRWFRENENSFYATMDAATQRRRAMNRRLHAAPEAPDGVPRLGPAAPPVRSALLDRWLQLCWGRTGWVCVQLAGRRVHTLFLFGLQQRTYAIDISPAR